MLANHNTLAPDDLYTITAGGFSATADAFARDDDTDASGSSPWSAPRRLSRPSGPPCSSSPPTPAHLIRGADGMALSGGYQRCVIPHETIRTWTTKIARLPVSGGWHALVYTKTAEYAFERDSFLLLAQSEEEAPALHHRFLDKRSPLPLHRSWADCPWRKCLQQGTIVPLQVGGPRRLPVLSQGRVAQRGPLRGGGVGQAHPAQGGRPPMDRTLKTAKRRNKRRSNRNYGAWQRFSLDGRLCRYCAHDNTKHLCSSGRPTSTGRLRRWRPRTPRRCSTATTFPRTARRW